MSADAFATSDHIPIPSLRTPARSIPWVDDPVALRALYTRVHWVTVARLDQTIYHTLLVVLVENRSDVLSVRLIEDARELVSTCQAKRAKVQRDFLDVTARPDDEAALEAMHEFIVRTIDQEKSNESPEFEFLFAP